MQELKPLLSVKTEENPDVIHILIKNDYVNFLLNAYVMKQNCKTSATENSISAARAMITPI